MVSVIGELILSTQISRVLVVLPMLCTLKWRAWTRFFFPNGEEADEDDLGAPDDYPVEGTFVIHFELQLAKKMCPCQFRSEANASFCLNTSWNVVR